ncbi:MAG: tryptophan synthase beta chain, partial [Pseudomonadales bacterium]
MSTATTLRQGPDINGFFGHFGGRFVAETLMPLVLELQEEYARARNSKEFIDEMDALRRDFVGRKSPLYLAERLTEQLGGAKV